MAKCEKCGRGKAGEDGLCYYCREKRAVIDGVRIDRQPAFCELCGTQKGKTIEFMKGKELDLGYWPYHLQHLRNGGQLRIFLCFDCASRETAKSFCHAPHKGLLTHEEKCMFKYREANYYGDKILAEAIMKYCYQGGKDPMTLDLTQI
jgi:hypothetical protein